MAALPEAPPSSPPWSSSLARGGWRRISLHLLWCISLLPVQSAHAWGSHWCTSLSPSPAAHPSPSSTMVDLAPMQTDRALQFWRQCPDLHWICWSWRRPALIRSLTQG
ncbi:hypothetical protein BDA96_05G236400 [Sorghum bicolor]|uniref:Uncharacterized protein n=1 Tax=Sorghum bicolor TaxID=4558 RepID=A0A921R029_SORBI|nr:hypothetical protein BDA96_05G236400 [Sorghum bicolor]